MSEWERVTLGEVADINPEKTPKWADDHEISYIDIASVSHEHGIDESLVKRVAFGDAPVRARRRIQAADVLISTVRPNLRAFATVPPSLDGEVASTGFAVVREGGRLAPGFSWCLASSDDFAEDMVSKCTGSNYPAVRAEDVASFPFALPSLVEQRRIVDVMAAVDAQIEALQVERHGALRLYASGLGLLWGESATAGAQSRPLSDVMVLDLQKVRLEDEGSYRLAGVLNAGQGLIDKGTLRGADSNYGTMNRITTNQVVMRKLTAWEGPIAVVPSQFDGFVASSEFPTFALSDDVSPAWMSHVCRTPRLWDEMKTRVTGSVQRRKRLNPDQLLGVVLPIPPLNYQKTVGSALDDLYAEVERLGIEVSALRTFRSTLLTSLLNQEIEIPESYDSLLEGGS